MSYRRSTRRFADQSARNLKHPLPQPSHLEREAEAWKTFDNSHTFIGSPILHNEENHKNHPEQNDYAVCAIIARSA